MATSPRAGRGSRLGAQAEGHLFPPVVPRPFPTSPAYPSPATPADLTSGKEPWLYTMSSEVLPQPPSPTITIFSSFLPGPGAAVGAGVPGASISRSPQYWQQRARQSVELRDRRRGRGGGGP